MTITEIQKAAFEVLFNLSGRCESIFVAGGSVVNLLLASDIDIWFGFNRKELAEKFLQKFDIHFKNESGDMTGSTLIGEALNPHTYQIVQVLTSPYETAQQLIDLFDISTHQWAYTSREGLVKGSQATTAEEPPKILKWTPKTFQRYVKICRRYGWPVDLELLKNYVEVPGSEPAFVKKAKKSLKEYLNQAQVTKGIDWHLDEEIPF